MNTLHFKYVAEVAKTGSITQAAENLYMAQPNLSKAIKELEETLGIAIFRRTSKGVVLTEKGEEFLVYAKRVLTQIGKMEALSDHRGLSRNRFSVCIPAGTYISHGLSRFASQAAQGEDLEMRVKEAGFLEGAGFISDGEVAFGVLRVPGEYLQQFQGFLGEKDLYFQTLWNAEYLVIMSEMHALAKAGEVTVDRLADFVEITGEEVSLPGLPGAEPPVQRQSGRKITAQGGDFLLALLSEVTNGYSWSSPLPRELLARYGLTQRKCKGAGKEFFDLLVYPKDYALSALDRAFIDILSVTKNQVAFEEYC